MQGPGGRFGLFGLLGLGWAWAAGIATAYLFAPRYVVYPQPYYPYPQPGPGPFPPGNQCQMMSGGGRASHELPSSLLSVRIPCMNVGPQLLVVGP